MNWQLILIAYVFLNFCYFTLLYLVIALYTAKKGVFTKWVMQKTTFKEDVLNFGLALIYCSVGIIPISIVVVAVNQVNENLISKANSLKDLK